MFDLNREKRSKITKAEKFILLIVIAIKSIEFTSGLHIFPIIMVVLFYPLIRLENYAR